MASIKRRRRRRLIYLSVFLLLLLAAAIWFLYRRATVVSTNDAYVRGNVIPIQALASGTVVEVAAEDTQFVHPGQVLVRLQGHRARIALERAKAELGEVVRQVQADFARVEVLRHRLAAQAAEVRRLEHDLARFHQVVGEGGVAHQTLQNTEDRLAAARARLRALRAQLKQARSLVAGTRLETHPRVEAAKNRLRDAWLAKQRQTIVAPVDGFIAKRRVQVGDQVRNGTLLMQLVPLDYLWAEAYFLETQLAAIRPGQKVSVVVDLYGGSHTFHGIVEGIWPATGSTFALIPPDTASGNFIRIRQRVGVRIRLDPEELGRFPLRPGLSTHVYVDTGSPRLPLFQKVTAPGKAVLRSGTTTAAPAYRTDVYQSELAGAETLIADIITANRIQGQ